MEINFYNFKKILNISSEMDLSLPGIKLKPAPNTTILDSEIIDGVPRQESMDIDLGEFKDERVNFLYDADSFYMDGTIQQKRYKGTEVTDLEDANGDDLIKYPTPILSVDNTLIYPPAQLVVNGSNLPIRPAHEYLKDDTFTQTSRKVMNDRIWLAACGIWPTEGYNLRKFIDYNNTTKSAVLIDGGNVRIPDNIETKARPWISIKEYNKKLKELRELLAPRGIDVVTTLFEKSVDVNGTDLNDSKISRKTDRNYFKVKPKSTSFIQNAQPNGRSDLLSPTNVDEISPFDVSIQTVQLAIGPDDEELFDDLVNAINNIRDNFNTLKARVAVRTNNVVSSTANTITLDSGASTVNDAYKNHIIDIISGPGSGQRKSISSYVGATRTATLTENWNTSLPLPNASSIYKILKPTYPEVDSDTPQEQFPGIIAQTRSLANKVRYSDIDSIDSTEEYESHIVFNQFKQSIVALDLLIRKIEWFEFFQGISLRKNRISILTGLETQQTQNYRKLSRILVPVDMGVKVTRVRRKTNNYVEAGIVAGATVVGGPVLGGLAFAFRRRRRYKYIRTDLGIRFAELRFVDASVLSKFRKNEHILLTSVINIATRTTAILPFNAYDEDNYYTNYSIEIMSGNAVGQIRKIISYDGASKTATIEGEWDIIPPQGSQFKIYKNYEVTNPDPVPLNVNVTFDMPHLPFDAELRKMAFDNLGFFDNTKNSNHTNIQDASGNVLVDFDNFTVANQNTLNTFYPGYEIFHNSSKEISAMRGGLDIYNKVQFLLTILKDKFSPSRVKLVETTRSLEDQNKIQFGGESSNFLSWHNYGLAAKIIVTDESEVTPIKDGSEDFFKLLDIADVFTTLCFNGSLGSPINVVWCGRLKTGPDNFVWEFLPIGVDHKDVWKFRDSIYNQIDPVIANAYVDVQTNGYIVPSSVTSDGPYIKDSSEALKNPIMTNGGIWVSPSDIRNYNIPSNLVLKDIQEFLFLVKNKITGNGSTLTANKDPFAWKSSNPISYNQLINYHSLLGNYNIVRLLMSMDYIDRFESIIITARTVDSRDFVRSFLGDVSYNNAKLNIRVDADSGFISIADGMLYINGTNVTNNNPEGNGNTFGQQQLSTDNITVQEVRYTISEAPVLTEKQLKVINNLIRDKILSEYKLIKDAFENINIEFLYDSIKNGSNAELFDTIENEFGIIKTQDLIPIQQIRELFNRVNINNNPENTSNPDGTLRGAAVSSEESVYEKLISTLETAEVSLVKPGNEKIIVEEVLEKPLEVYIKEIIKKQNPGAADIL